LNNSVVIPRKLAIYYSFSLRPDPPPAEARPGIQENQKVLDTRFRGYDEKTRDAIIPFFHYLLNASSLSAPFRGFQSKE
jgi:hypothetical protein